MKYYVNLELIQLFGASQQIKSTFLFHPVSDSLWTTGIQFHSPLETTSLFLQSRGTGGYGSAPAVPLSSYLLQLSVLSCLVITIKGSVSSLFLTTTLCFIFSASLFQLFFFSFFCSKWSSPQFSEMIWFESEI